MSAPRLVVFDVDGTLVDSQDHIFAAMTLAFAGLDLPPPPRAAVLAIVGLSLPEAIATLAPDLDAGRCAAIVASYKQGFAGATPGAPPLYPGARAALDALAADGAVLGIATGKSRRGLDKLLAAHGLSGHFATSQVADDHPSKPDPSMLHATLAATGAGAAAAVMVGDTSFDMAMARAAGFRAIGVAWGYHPAESLYAAGADRVIEGFADLVPALLSLGAPA